MNWQHDAAAEEPTAAELWNVEQLEAHACQLAQLLGSVTGTKRVKLRTCLRRSAVQLERTYLAISAALQARRAITPAAEWFVDNFHLVAGEIDDIALRLRPSVWRDLPGAASADSVGWPRIYCIVREYLAHTDCAFDTLSFTRYLQKYQTVDPLAMRELWTLNPVLRLALIDELRRLATRIEAALAARGAADEFANTFVSQAMHPGSPAPPLTVTLGKSAYQAPFVVQLALRLQSLGEERESILGQLSDKLHVQGTSIDEVIQREHARRSASNLTVRNIIISLRALHALNWRTLFENTSQVDLLLREHPSYRNCDRRTRDRYRECIAELAVESLQGERAIARRVTALLADGRDIGELLVGAERIALEKELGLRPRLATTLRRFMLSHAATWHFWTVAALTAAFVTLAIQVNRSAADLSFAQGALLAVLAMFPISEFAIAFVSQLWMSAYRHQPLPRLALEQGIPPDLKTLVVMPVMLRSAADALLFARELRVHALANSDSELRFALLSDWVDAPTVSLPDDQAIFEAASVAIAELNLQDRHPPAHEPRYYLLHRARQWNAAEQCFMGWERKRGKLAELNRLLLQSGATSFLANALNGLIAPSNIRYVMTIDADTRLPLGAVRDLVGVAAHPLNRPVFDPQLRRVVKGFGILQPRVTPLLPTIAERSLYREIVTGGSGLDPYASAVSDFYQDIFGEGLFTGKGLYDLAMTETSLADRVPENTLLSHDLFEGLFARCGLVSDVEVFEEFPSHSEVAAARSHRWIRGDWQLLPWIVGARGRLPRLGRWKMLENLRRSLHAPASMALLVSAWAMPAANPGIWLIVVLLPAAMPAIINSVARLAGQCATDTLVTNVRQLVIELIEDLARALAGLALLAQSAWLSADAISRALWRLLVSHRKLLQWVTAAQSKAQSNQALRSFVWSMRGASVIVLCATAVILWLHPQAMLGAAPLLLAWWLSPLLARMLSRPFGWHWRTRTVSTLATRGLRRVARRTWHYFETLVTADHHFLPPDNFQADPLPVTAHRSSPTNIGLYLLATIAARDFGWLGLVQLSRRLGETLTTLERLERFNGHFLNWYDTQTLAPLTPKYVSTVDSGNLAGHLIAIRQALQGMQNQPLLAPDILRAPQESLGFCCEALATTPDSVSFGAGALPDLHSSIAELQATLTRDCSGFMDTVHSCKLAADQATAIADIATALQVERGAGFAAVVTWAKALRQDVDTHAREIASLSTALPPGLPDSARERWQELEQQLPRDATLRDLENHHACALREVESWPGDSWPATAARARLRLLADIRRALATVVALRIELQALAQRCGALFDGMQFGFLYDRDHGLLSIGFRVAELAMDASNYDLLASEARLASFVAIAKGDIPRSHWQRLGRRLTGGSWHAVLASWSGSMFEYLMPALVMREPRYSLLDQSNRRAIRHQIRAGVRNGHPWGISESAYNVRDRELTYQYSAFGLATLGLKRGLAANIVVAPYATALAAMYEPEDAYRNFIRLESIAGFGEYGFFEAIDFTPQRLPDASDAVVVQAFMAHHQGMTLVALDNALHANIMQRRFHDEPLIQSAELLLQERAVRFATAPALIEIDAPAASAHEESPDMERGVVGHHSPTPVTHLLSNRHYGVMLTDSGAGYSLCKSRAVTRWREDATADCWGTFLFLRDIVSGKFWSAGFQPTGVVPQRYEVVYKEERVVITRSDGSLTTTLEVIVSAQDNGELRRVSIHNDGIRARHIELTSYAELVLAPAGADIAHPAFSNLFLSTEFVGESNALLAQRHPRGAHESACWAVHVLQSSLAGAVPLEYETDRAQFLGRGRNVHAPIVIEDGRPLSNTVGSVLDPIFSLRTRIHVAPGATVSVTFATLVADSREQALALAGKYRHPAIFQIATDLAWTFVRAELHYLQCELHEARTFQQLAGHLVYANRLLRSSGTLIAANRLDVSRLWRFAISGDRPILVIRCRGGDDLSQLRQCLRAQEYLRIKRLHVDVVILNDVQNAYFRELQDNIERLVRLHSSRGAGPDNDERGTVSALLTDSMSSEERDLLLALARVVLLPSQGSLAEQLRRPDRNMGIASALRLASPRTADQDNGAVPSAAPAPAREFFNGLGGFGEDGSEYQITLRPGTMTPAPWCNVIANEQFGSLVSENGSMYTWSLNSRENQLTPWSNDPVCDPTGEAFYILDGVARQLWSPTPLPIRLPLAHYEVHHGQGYSRFQLLTRGIASELTVLVAPEDPVKWCRLRLTNHTDRPRQLTVAVYLEWVMGADRGRSAPNVVTHLDAETGAMLCRNAARIDFGQRIAFCDLGGRQQYVTASRREFLGRNGQLAAPAGMENVAAWSGRTGAGLDPCCALAVSVELKPHESQDFDCLLGQAADSAAATALVRRYRALAFDAVLQTVRRNWSTLLGAVQIRTPDRAVDVLFNRWLLYQTISCRLWGRAGFYQAGGAFGFRDQLQDGMAIALSSPALTRAHLLRAAARQFPQGDVQHWWHPPSGRGVRTHFSDDRNWLPFAVSQYVATSGDWVVLDEPIAFVEGDLLAGDQEDAHFQPAISIQRSSLFDHCARALDSSLLLGTHGLPLIGGGDWNDGMNRVGHEGRGESVWLAWFLVTNLRQFAAIAAARGDDAHAQRWRQHADALAAACETHGWDGAWYRRAFFDDGTPLGSAANAECRIDSIAQSWAVLSGAADPQRAARAMDSVERHLVRGGDGLVLLFAPPFVNSRPDPGYVQSYLPGVRENGGQYTHAAIWVLMAQAALGEQSQVASLLDMLNPVRRTESRSGVQAYRVEPYVMAADIYSMPPHARRGGWTWYTGAAGWFYQAILESVLGVQVRDDSLSIKPCLPGHWNGFEIDLKVNGADYLIQVARIDASQAVGVDLDGVRLADGKIPLHADGRQHTLLVRIA